MIGPPIDWMEDWAAEERESKGISNYRQQDPIRHVLVVGWSEPHWCYFYEQAGLQANGSKIELATYVLMVGWTDPPRCYSYEQAGSQAT